MDLFIFSEGDPSLYEANYRSLKHIIETALDSRKVCKAEPCTNNGIVQCEALITRSCMGFLLIISIFYLSPIRSSKVCRITPDKGLWALCCIFVCLTEFKRERKGYIIAAFGTFILCKLNLMNNCKWGHKVI